MWKFMLPKYVSENSCLKLILLFKYKLIRRGGEGGRRKWPNWLFSYTHYNHLISFTVEIDDSNIIWKRQAKRIYQKYQKLYERFEFLSIVNNSETHPEMCFVTLAIENRTVVLLRLPQHLILFISLYFISTVVSISPHHSLHNPNLCLNILKLCTQGMKGFWIF